MGEAKRLRDRLKAEQDRSEREEKVHIRAQKAEGELATLRAENERLRGDLRRIAEGNLGDEPWQANYEVIRHVAKEALK